MDQEDIFWMSREGDDDVGTFQSKRPDICGQLIMPTILEAQIISTLALGENPFKLVIVSGCSFCVGQKHGEARSTGSIVSLLSRAGCALSRSSCGSILRMLRDNTLKKA